MLGDIHIANGNLTESKVCYQKAHLLDKVLGGLFSTVYIRYTQ